MGILRITKDWAIDDDRLVIWSFEGVSESAYNGLVDYYDIKEVVINTGKNSVIPDFVFYACQRIESVVIKDGVVSIGNHAFYDCSKLTSVTIPDSVTSIGRCAFRGCSSLTSVTIPDSVVSIGSIAFYGCSGLTSVVIPDSVTSIGNYVFFGCSDLKNISIPAQLEIRPKEIVDSDCAITRRLKKEANMTETNNTEKRKEVDLYDPKFVHFDWDETLRGKTVFYCDSIIALKYSVRTHYTDKYYVIEGSSDSSCPFRIQGGSVWQFAYYDPNYEVKWAYFKEGKEVQIRRGSADEWEDLCPWSKTRAIEGPEFFDDEYQYRIKPEDKQKPNVEVNVDVKVNNTSTSDGKIKITINGKECVFENAEQARMVLKG